MKKLRAHHLFCGTLFSGHGYDESFTANMTELLKAVGDGEEILLCEGPDDLCAACPNKTEKVGCFLGTEDVLNRDRAAFSALKFQKGETVSWDEVTKRLCNVSGRDFSSVCGGCRWEKEGLCSYELLLKRVGRE